MLRLVSAALVMPATTFVAGDTPPPTPPELHLSRERQAVEAYYVFYVVLKHSRALSFAMTGKQDSLLKEQSPPLEEPRQQITAEQKSVVCSHLPRPPLL